MSEKRRFFVEEITGENVTLTGEEYTHARNVLRLDVGGELILLDNSGTEYDGIITSVGKKEMNVHIVGSKIGEREAKTDVKLLFGYLKNADKNEFVVQKATELGVNSIVLFTSEYSSAYVNDNKIERLRKVAQEAAKQCLRSRAPEIIYAPTLNEALNAGMGYVNKIFACEFLHENQADLQKIKGSTALVIGSEGGFSQAEFENATKMGYKGVTLGKRILRAETAAVALTSVVMFNLGEME
ncbi:MAG: 16S rRNA (uracil(1498)-N(3))-methyltransferase [Clostridia bacterium]|nr:16S rRNA (uracil(1498)-N(3))-methyltransferase [Clostridia bacterium]